MLRVLEECEHVSTDFAPDPVHDLRVSLRRCRSLADGLMALDPDPNWKAMKKAGKRLFQRLGALRDIHVMMEWVEKLAPTHTQVDAGDHFGFAQGRLARVAGIHPESEIHSRLADGWRSCGPSPAANSHRPRARTEARSSRRPRRV